MNFNDIAILNIKGSNYRCIISRISKSEAINLMQNADLTPKKAEHYKIYNSLSYTRMVKEILTFGDTEIEKNKLYRHKSPIFLKDVNIEKV